MALTFPQVRRAIFGRKPAPPPPSRSDSPPMSLVLLLRQPRTLDEPTLARLAEQAYGRPFATEGDWLVRQVKPGLFGVMAGGRRLGVLNIARPYAPDPKAMADRVRSARLKQAILDHRAWIAVDWLGGQADAKAAYPAMGRLLAELADDDCLAVYMPREGRIASYHTGVKPALRSQDPYAAFAIPTPPATAPGTAATGQAASRPAP